MLYVITVILIVAIKKFNVFFKLLYYMNDGQTRQIRVKSAIQKGIPYRQKSNNTCDPYRFSTRDYDRVKKWQM